MKRKIIFLLLAAVFGLCEANAQNVIVINNTTCDLMIYGGEIYVSGTDYFWGSETPGVSMSYGQTTALFTTNPALATAWQSPPPPPPPSYAQLLFYGLPPTLVPYAPGATKYVGFKFRQPNMGSGAGYISAVNPYVMSSAPAGCNNGLPFVVEWTGPADNPIVTIHP